MKRLELNAPWLLAVVIALAWIPSIALAGSYTVTTNAAQDTRLDRARLKANTATCASVGLPSNCTDAEAKAKNPALEVYPTIQTYILGTLKAHVVDSTAQQEAEDAAAFCTAFKALSTANKNATCAAAGLSNGCTPCR